MSKSSEVPRVLDATAIKKYLSEQDDFGLELRALHQARNLGFQVRHSGTYQDPAMEKPRQYDLRIVRQSGINRVSFAIECKALSTSFPLIVSRVPRATSEAFHCLVRVQRNHIPPASIVTRNNSRFYSSGMPVAKATTQFGWGRDNVIKSNDSATYDKWSQALSSAHDLIMEAFPLIDTASAEPLSAAVLPVLVVSNHCLWAVDYSEDGKQSSSPIQLDEAELFVDREYETKARKFRASHLQICTENGLKELLNSATAGTCWWNNLFEA